MEKMHRHLLRYRGCLCRTAECAEATIHNNTQLKSNVTPKSRSSDFCPTKNYGGMVVVRACVNVCVCVEEREGRGGGGDWCHSEISV